MNMHRDLSDSRPEKKPILLYEYTHGIGNGAEAITEYIDLLPRAARVCKVAFLGTGRARASRRTPQPARYFTGTATPVA